MKIFTFKHGIHPQENKSTAAIPIEMILPKPGEELIYPMVQHIGAPCAPVVKPGDYVKVGHKIAEATGFVSSPIHASVSGAVKEIRPSLTPTGITCDSVVIENDGKMLDVDEIAPIKDYLSLTREQYLERIREAGIVGLGGAGFPTHVKLSPPPDKKIDYIIINASECEPYLTSDHRALLEQSENLKQGIQILLKIFPEAKAILAIEANKMDAIEKMKQVCANEKRIEVFVLKPKYPQGSEKQLIYACLKRQVPSGGLPADVGCIVQNVDTVIAIDRCVNKDKPLMRKIITINGGAMNKVGNYKVRIGMTVRSLIEASGGLKSQPCKIVIGGPMMGVAQFDLDVPITKTTSAILCLTDEEAKLPDEKNCIRCAKCVDHCPIGLMPLDLNQFAIRNEIDMFEKFNGVDCIECGSCSYVCPSKRHLAHSIRFMRQQILAKRKNK